MAPPQFAGWWHLHRDEPMQTWRMTAPSGETLTREVRPREKPVGALVGSVPGLRFDGIVKAIMQHWLFPP